MTKQASNIIAGDDRPGGESAGLRLSAQAEAQLVRSAQGGQVEAFGQLVRAYQDRLYNVVYRLCGRESDAEELAQEAFLKAFEKLDQFRGGSRFFTWLFRIATNLALSHRRRTRRVKFHSLNGTNADADESFVAATAQVRTAQLAASRNPGPEAVAISRETAREVTNAVEELDEDFRVVVILRDAQDLAYDEIAEILDLPPGTVKSRLHRARTILKGKLAHLVQVK